MNVLSFTDSYGPDLVKFLSLCYCKIGRAIDLDGKDKDILNIECEYRGTGGDFFLLVDNNQIVGTIAVKFFLAPKGLVGEIHRFYVHPDRQKKGGGTALLNFIYNYAKERNAAYLRGTTEYGLKDAIALFKKVGAYEIPKYRKSHAEVFLEFAIPENIPSKDFSSVSAELKRSFQRLESDSKKTLILNPVENYPSPDILFPCGSSVHGFYNTDSIRSQEEQLRSKIQFSGRTAVTEDVNHIYEEWAKLLGGKVVTMRLLSGLHAHIVMFMALTSIHDRVILLPEVAGGHMATKSILLRLGLNIKELPVDFQHQKVDAAASQKLIEEFKPKIIFIDRSEGLLYEDFSWMNEVDGPIKIFDASQYLTNIIAGDYANPFEFGFDLVLSTTHKNLPGPQRALICGKEKNEIWQQLKSGISTFVSNMHFHSIYSAGLMLGHYSHLQKLSRQMLENTKALDAKLRTYGVPCIIRDETPIVPSTHHIWVSAPSCEAAFEWYLNLEQVGILVNYRKLPYELGYGLRLGLSAATYRGLRERHIQILASIVAKGMQSPSDRLCAELQKLLNDIDREKNEE